MKRTETMTVRELLKELCTFNMDAVLVIKVGDSICGLSHIDFQYLDEPQIVAKQDEEYFAKEIGWVEKEYTN